ncbi:MAG: hypothetical protein K0S32_3774 [Bacteroidetes bacterium]|nr:hypothetical protein [Bacteroidota bacterium]
MVGGNFLSLNHRETEKAYPFYILHLIYLHLIYADKQQTP